MLDENNPFAKSGRDFKELTFAGLQWPIYLML